MDRFADSHTMTTKASAPPPENARRWNGTVLADALALSMFYFALAWASHAFTSSSHTLAAIWSPSAILLGILLQSRHSEWPLFAIAAFVASFGAAFAHIQSLPASAGLAAAEIVEPLAAALMLRAIWSRGFDLSRITQIAGLTAVSALTNSAIGAPIGAAVLAMTNGDSFGAAWLNWWLSGTTGAMVICPLLLSWNGAREALAQATRRATLELVLTLLLAAALCIALFSQPLAPLLFPIFPLTLWVAYRFGVFPAAFLCLSVALVSIGMTWLGFGPIHRFGGTLDDRLRLLQSFIAVMTLTALTVAIAWQRSRQAQAGLNENSLLLQTTFDTMAQGICVYDKDLRLATFNQKYVELLGYPPGAIRVGGRLEDHLWNCADRGLFGPGDRAQQVAERLEAAQYNVSQRRVYERGDGVVVVAHRRAMPQGGFVTTFSDITERQSAEAALRSSTMALQDIKASFEAAIKASRQILYDWNTQNDVVKWDGETELILGYTAAELERLPNWMELIHPDDCRHFVRERAQAVMGHDVFSLEYRVCRRDGRYIPVVDRGVFLHGTPGGAKRIVGFISDISTQKSAEEALRQSDKLLAVGQLTGGIAHDFNNLLAIILGNLELLKEDLQGDENHHRHIETAVNAAQRGADLTQRLLAFARKQPLQPQRVMLNELVRDISELVRRSIDASIALELRLAEDLGITTIDPTGLENALLNLALNARDAMPKGGRLIIETKNLRLDEAFVRPLSDVSPGEYVLLSVTDTGCGMSADVRERAFEPFFTTKGLGRGNGLGLAMVYGFVKQSHGHIQLSSDYGVGTTVKLFLPRVGDGELPEIELPAKVEQGAGSGERILVVEDNDDVRSLTNILLTGLGYRTILASDAPSALAVLATQDDIDVLFTDVVLPGGTNGFELADRAQELRPSLKVLYTSGYPNNAAYRSEPNSRAVVLIAKPYRKADLAAKMREVLARENADDAR